MYFLVLCAGSVGFYWGIKHNEVLMVVVAPVVAFVVLFAIAAIWRRRSNAE